MDKEKPLLKYFFEGFSLTNHNIEIYLIGLIIVLLPSLLYAVSPNLPILNTLSPVFYLVAFGFKLSIPKFLIQKHHDKSLVFKNIFSTTIQNTGKIILPAILLFIIFTILLMIAFALVAIFLRPTPGQISQFFESWNYSNIRWHPFLLFLFPIFSFFVFSPILFSLEHKGLFASIIGSIITSFHHLPYLAIVIAVDFISFAVTSFLPANEVWGSSIRYIVSSYISLVIISSTLFYYQKRIANESVTPQTTV